MRYKYLNPRTKKHAETKDYSSAGYAGDWEGPELIVECTITTLKNYLTL